jgi:hypothetical protein
MRLTPKQRIDVILARQQASLSNLAFAMNLAAEAAAEFAFTTSCAYGTDESKRAAEIAESALARASNTPTYS